MAGLSSTRCAMVPRQPSTRPTPEDALRAIQRGLAGWRSRRAQPASSSSHEQGDRGLDFLGAHQEPGQHVSAGLGDDLQAGGGVGEGVVAAGVDGRRRWPGRRSRARRCRWPVRAVRIAVPVNRSRTTLWPSARATISATSAAISCELAGGGAADAGAAPPGRTAPRSSRWPVTSALSRSSRSRTRRACALRSAVPDVVAQRAEVGDVVVEPFQLEQHRPRSRSPEPGPASPGRPRPRGRRRGCARRRCRRRPARPAARASARCGPRRASRCRGGRTTAGP